MNEYLRTARRQLEDMEAKNKEKPPGDERAQTQWVIEQVRDLIIKADVKLSKRQSALKDMDKIEEIFTKYL